MASDLAFPWAREYDADQLAAFIEDLWGAASGDNDLDTLDAIEKVIAEHRPDPVPCPLTARQIEVLTQLATGETYESAARNLGVSVSSFKRHCEAIYTRLGVRNMTQATVIAADLRWLPGIPVPVPPPRARKLGPHRWRAIYRKHVAQMRKRPRHPVEIGPYSSCSGARNAAWRMNKGLLSQFQPTGAFNAQAVRSDSGHWVVLARYLGTTDTAEREES
ncbi:response regulator transcription factor [Streptomyces sp. KR55]|uniref:response regulator transcription factor n=1 Tax=Streptomyces sp. KR55 TaxID=3457425 RepID=UPI003FD4D4D5